MSSILSHEKMTFLQRANRDAHGEITVGLLSNALTRVVAEGLEKQGYLEQINRWPFPMYSLTKKGTRAAAYPQQ